VWASHPLRVTAGVTFLELPRVRRQPDRYQW